MKSPKDSAVEHFVWSVGGKIGDKVIYYDQAGTCIERPVPKGVLDDVVKVFDGRPRSIRRTSGGLSLCEPHQIVIYDRAILDPQTLWQPGKDLQSCIRVRVTFHELLRDSSGKVLGADTVLQTKITTWQELQEPFIVPVGGSGITLADFGSGTIPICVFHIAQKPLAEPVAYFTEAGVLDALKAKPQGSLSLVTIYAVPLKTVRIPDGDSSIDAARAQENHLYLMGRQMKVVPDILKLQTKIPLPSGKSIHYLQSCLTAMLNPSERKEIEPYLIRVQEDDELLPFGFYEQN